MRMKKLITLVISATMMSLVLAGCSSKTSSTSGTATSNQKVKIEIFQYKPEAKTTFDGLIKKFESENPNIEVVQTQVPDSATVLKTRVAKGDVPDIVATGAEASFAETVKAGVFEDLSNDPLVSNVQPAYIKMLKDVTNTDKVYAVPYAANADAVIYNKKLFKDLGLTIPTTWDDFIKLCDKIKAAGQVPFYFAFKDSWTTLPSYNVLVANTMPENFFNDRTAGKNTFKTDFKEATDKFLQLVSYGQPDILGKSYNDGNTAFAKGESVMYLQGIWALAEIKKANPDIDLGVFPYPVTNDASKNKVVSGIDLLYALSKNSKHKDEAKKFIEFLVNQDTAKQYITEQKCFSALKGITQDDPTLDGLKDNFLKGLVVDFPDHYLPSALTTDAKLQALAKDKDTDKFLSSMDKEWDSIQSRK